MTRAKHSAKKRSPFEILKFSFEIWLYVQTGTLTAVFDRIPYLQFLYMKINIFLIGKYVSNYFANHALLNIYWFATLIQINCGIFFLHFADKILMF